MTLTIGCVTEWGAWMCADMREISPAPHRRVQDRAIKSFGFCSPDKAALFGISGLAISEYNPLVEKLSVDMPLSQWIEALRVSIAEYISQQAALDRSKRLTVSVAGFWDREPFLVELGNRQDSADWTARTVDWAAGEVLCCGGGRKAVARSNLTAISQFLQSNPSSNEVAIRLGELNRSVAFHPTTRKIVSPACIVDYVPATCGSKIERWLVPPIGEPRLMSLAAGGG